MRKTITSLMAALLMSVASVALAQPPRGQGGRGAGPGMAATLEIVKKLDLTEAQTKAWEAIRSEMEETTAPIRERMHELRVAGEQPDREESTKRREEMRKAFTKAEEDLLDILDDDQKAKFDELKKAAESERGRGRGGMRGEHRGGRGAENGSRGF